MPNEGDISYSYGRQYRYIKPNSSDPGTYRLSAPEEGTGSPGGGGGTGVEHNVTGVNPIQAATTSTTTKNTVISFDIQSLSPRV